MLANHGIALRRRRARHAAASPTCSRRTSRHDMDIARRAPPRREDDHLRARCAARARSQIGFDQVSARPRHRVLGRGRRRHAARCTARCGRASRPTPKLRHVYADDRDAGARGAVRHGAQRRAGRPRRCSRAQSGELGASVMAELEARGARARRAAVQPRRARSRSARSCSSELKLPVVKKTRERRAVDRRGGAREARRGLSAAEGAARAPRRCPSSSRTYTRQAAAHDRPRAPAACTPATAQAIGGHRAAVVERPEPAEHPDPHGRGPAHPRGVHRAAGPRASSSADYSQIELRIMAHLSRRRGPARARSHAGEDIHRATAAEVFGVPLGEVTQRAAPLRQGDQLRPDLRHERVRPRAATSASSAARRSSYIDRYFARYPGVADVHGAHARAGASEQGYVETVFGRRLWLPDIKLAERAAPRGRRARGDQRADAGHGGRPDQAGDDRGARLAASASGSRRGSSCRCTTSSCSRCPDGELGARAGASCPDADDRRGAARRCRWWSTSASGRTGSEAH
ncbi:MAG: DNA polymerase [Chromatiales bacterium]|nr:DNA polymerase [Chromatiales bacterium]